MADLPSQTVDSISEWAGASTSRPEVQSNQDFAGPPQWLSADGGLLGDLDTSAPRAVGSPTPPVAGDRDCVVTQSLAEVWFDQVHVLPRRIDLGNILGTVQVSIDIYNAYQDQARTFESWTNNAGSGINIIDLPSLPASVPAQSGLSLTMEVVIDGPPSINGTTDYGFDLGILVLQPITGSRIVVFPFRPERPLVERLEFLTDIIRKKQGQEQRIALRKNPRQTMELLLRVDEGRQSSRVRNTLFDWQSRVFGVPVWWEPSYVRAAASSGATQILVNSTSYADLRVNGLGIVFLDDLTFDVLEIQTIAADSITFKSPTTNAYPVGAEVFPVRTAVLPSRVGMRRSRVNLDELELPFRVTDNDSDLADTSAFSTFNSKVLLDDPNAIRGEMRRSLVREVLGQDGSVGLFSQKSQWDRSMLGSTKTAQVRTRQRLWEYRQLLHALRGRQVSFYLPTFWTELVVTAQLGNGSTSMTIENIEYARFAQNRQPLNVLRLEKTDGTIITRTVTDSSEIDGDTEQLTVDAGWPEDIPVVDIRRVDLLEEVRLDSDVVRITHRDASGQADIEFPVRSVLE